MRELTSFYNAAYDGREQRIIKMALAILDRKITQQSNLMTSVDAVRHYLRLNLEREEREVFMVLFLNNKNRLIASECLFAGSINSVEVHSREVVRRAAQLNAAAVIFAHNHPSGDADPSDADRKITDKLVKALALIDTRVLDHMVIGHGEIVSFAERGWLSPN